MRINSQQITRWGRLKQVLNGIDAAQKAGLRVKINAVALKGFNEPELSPRSPNGAPNATWT